MNASEMASSTIDASTSRRFRSGPIAKSDCDVLRHSYAFTVWQTTIAANTIVERVAWWAPASGRRSPGRHPKRTAAPTGSMASESAASTTPRKANERSRVKRSSNRSRRERGGVTMARSSAGSGPSAEQVREFPVVGRELRPDRHLAVWQPRRARDGGRRRRMVARHHDHPDAGPAALCDRARNLGPHRILEPDEAEQLEPRFR